MVKSFSILFNVYQDNGDWVSECWSLPGVAGSGDTKEQALADGWQALALAVLSYSEQERPIPWVTEARTGNSG